MFYRMIEKKCKEWYASDQCTAKNIVDYIETVGQMRDAQIDAIKTYLFLKIACACKPLETLFKSGAFNTLDLDNEPLITSTRDYLKSHPAAAALYEYSLQKNDRNEQVSAQIEKQIKKDPQSIDYSDVFHRFFYKVSYTDYLFSLPMGAGKTFLMAAFIYLDLYFAKNELQNPAFAHNFIIFAPSGLKSSVVPSLKTIQRFEPSWVLPEPAASEIKKEIKFEVLDQAKTASKSNKTKNPNVQKIAGYQPFSDLFGLVAVTNAEKVILDRIAEDNGIVRLDIFDDDDEKDRQANELRNLIGKLPSLSIFIDEVHHAVSDEIRLRAVVTNWAQNQTINSVIGFSGTPYIDHAERIAITDQLSVGTKEISNIVYYYPLVAGIGNFLKRPIVKIAELPDSKLIVERGVREFLDCYKDTVYEGGLSAKLGIYCGTIEKLEQVIYPLVAGIVAEYGLSGESILKFHKGNKQYPQPADSQMQFDLLDKSISNTRIVLLVQIGKEGWDCRSLTGIILSQEGDCPMNMVLQTSCRCLRQVSKGVPETALIYLNGSNAGQLSDQLQKQQHITLDEFQKGYKEKTTLSRFDRTKYLKLPKVDFYQLKVHYGELITEKADPARSIQKSAPAERRPDGVIKTTDFTMSSEHTSIKTVDEERGQEHASFEAWLYGIMKGGFGSPSMEELKVYSSELRAVFDTITYEHGGRRLFSSKYDRKAVEENIRKAFFDKRDIKTTEELIPEEASLLNIQNFTPSVVTSTPELYYPDEKAVINIDAADKGKLLIDKKTEELIRLLEETGNQQMADDLRKRSYPHVNKDRSFHYLPYKTDSDFEQTFLKEVLSFEEIEKLGLEVYYNGDRAMTEFKIKCYKKKGSQWSYVGMYTPDFLIIKRKDGKIHKAIIVETKGKIYANDPMFKDKKLFMETEFLKQNNAKFGYRRFDYLYLEDSLSEQRMIKQVYNTIIGFFEEKKHE